uniref:Dynamin-type G domain-containing protein n=1 Tax=Hucho hucho TaxID=62062 RepID=A0A4W5RKI4_9TELE
MFQDQLAEKVRPFIDLIDDMRSIGIDKELPLPTIAVVGDQSSGKSSVLETLSGVALPRGTGIVTRCPLQLHYKTDKQTNNRQVLFHQYFPIDLTAQNVLAGKGVGICEDLITLKITSSTVCDLSLIDLPGITRVAVKGQPDDIGAHIKNLILKFIKNKRTIILVVVPCNVDIATTEALKMAQEMDPEGTRTLAILTKPDLIDPGAEKNVLEIVHNRVIFLNMGYVIVKCRGQKQIDENMSITHAIEEELEFFRNHEHFRSLLREEKATTKCLATKLSNALVKQIKVSPTKHPTFICSPYTKCTLENMWSDHEVVHQVVDEYDQKHRGTELPGFSNYRVFQHVVQKLVAKLKIPAMTTLQKIRGKFLGGFFTGDIWSKCDCRSNRGRLSMLVRHTCLRWLDRFSSLGWLVRLLRLSRLYSFPRLIRLYRFSRLSRSNRPAPGPRGHPSDRLPVAGAARGREGVVSRLLQLPLSGARCRQFIPYYAHLSRSLHTSYCFCSVFHVCTLLVFLVLFHVCLFIKFTPCTCFLIYWRTC